MKLIKFIYYFCFILLAIIVVLTLFGRIHTAETFSSWFWVLLTLAVSFNFVKIFLRTRRLGKLKHKLQFVLQTFRIPKRNRLFLATLFLVIVFLSGLDKNYYLGGDDTRFFYFFPVEYYRNLSSRVISDNALSNLMNFLPANSTSAFVLLLAGLKYLVGNFNLQNMLYNANIFLGIYFFYKFLELVLPENKNLFLLRIISSLMYVFSIFNIYTLYNSRLIAIFIISIFPFSAYFFLKAVKEKQWLFLALIAIVWSIFSIVGVSVFWFAGSVLVLLPFLVQLFWEKKLITLKYLTLLGFLLVVLNFHWLIFLPYTSLLGQSGAHAENSITSQNFLDISAEGIRSNASVNSLFYPLMNTYHFQIQKNFNWPYLPIFKSWYLKILPINSIFIISVIVAGLLIRRNSRYFRLYIFSTLALLTAVYFFTVNMGNTKLGNWGIEVFVWLSRNVPGFIVFRNMYDKFGHGLSAAFSVSAYISLVVIFLKLKSKKIQNAILGIFFVAVFLTAKPFLFQEFNNLPVWTTRNTYQSISKLNNDYSDLINFAKSQEFRGRYVLLPLNRGNNAIIQDEFKENHYYTGVSPFLILSGVNDFSGTLSFGPYDQQIFKAIADEEYEEVGRIFQIMNARYLVVNKDISSELQNSYLYSEGFYCKQQGEFLKEILGEKIRDFGGRYSLYEINNKYKSEKIYITDDFEDVPELFGRLTYKKISSQEYQINISDFSGIKKLVFLDSYYKGWKLYLSDGKELKIDPVNKPFGYAMGWEINSKDLASGNVLDTYSKNSDGSIDLELRLYFEPHKYYYLAFFLSILGYGILTILIIKHWVGKARKQIHENI